MLIGKDDNKMLESSSKLPRWVYPYGPVQGFAECLFRPLDHVPCAITHTVLSFSALSIAWRMITNIAINNIESKQENCDFYSQ